MLRTLQQPIVAISPTPMLGTTDALPALAPLTAAELAALYRSWRFGPHRAPRDGFGGRATP